MKMENECIFCRIISGSETAFIVQESMQAIAILPKLMEVKGHTLVVPKLHVQDIFDIPKDVLSEVMGLVREVSLTLRKNLKADGINILHASGKAAQQSVDHFHVHVIPRFLGDNIDAWPDLPGCDFSHMNILDLFKNN